MRRESRDSTTTPLELAERLDERVLASIPCERCTPNQLLVWMYATLGEHAARGVDVHALIKMSRQTDGGERTFLCGERDGPQFRKRDGLACRFKINVRVSHAQRELHLLSYALQVVAPCEEAATPRFLRWEFSRERKPGVDAAGEPRSHLHPGHQRIRLPSPVMSPKELVSLFVNLTAWR